MANVRFNNPLNGTSTDVNSSVTNKPTRVFAKARLPGSVSFTIDDRNLLPEFKLLAAACEERGFRAGFAMITRATLGDGVGKKLLPTILMMQTGQICVPFTTKAIIFTLIQ